RERAREVVAEVSVRMLLQVGEQFTCHGGALARRHDDAAGAAGTVEEKFADAEPDEKQQGCGGQGDDVGRRTAGGIVGDGMGHHADDLSDCVGHQDAAYGSTHFEQHDDPVPPPKLPEEMQGETQGGGGQGGTGLIQVLPCCKTEKKKAGAYDLRLAFVMLAGTTHSANW